MRQLIAVPTKPLGKNGVSGNEVIAVKQSPLSSVAIKETCLLSVSRHFIACALRALDSHDLDREPCVSPRVLKLILTINENSLTGNNTALALVTHRIR
jgi:hypothetical protein